MKQGIQFNMKHIYNNYRYAVAFLGVGCVNIHIEEVIYKLVVKDDDGWSDIPWWVPQLRLPSFPPPAPCTAAATWTKQSNTVILIAVEFVNH